MTSLRCSTLFQLNFPATRKKRYWWVKRNYCGDAPSTGFYRGAWVVEAICELGLEGIWAPRGGGTFGLRLQLNPVGLYLDRYGSMGCAFQARFKFYRRLHDHIRVRIVALDIRNFNKSITPSSVKAFKYIIFGHLMKLEQKPIVDGESQDDGDDSEIEVSPPELQEESNIGSGIESPLTSITPSSDHQPLPVLPAQPRRSKHTKN
ncbi:hypothetical protein DFH09DRAFT_1073271 [Mycena vulgaris]|nr:hypothetical protein DFH09DRAFT_1073271 [Mycena vulgaris]